MATLDVWTLAITAPTYAGLIALAIQLRRLSRKLDNADNDVWVPCLEQRPPEPEPPKTPERPKPATYVSTPTKTVLLEVEMPEPQVPEKISMSYSKFVRLMDLLNASPEKTENRNANINTNTSINNNNNLLRILEAVSGLKFKDDKVLCPKHGWTHYVVLEDGRVLCSTGRETLWGPKTPEQADKKDLEEIREGLKKLQAEMEELRRQATPPEITPPEEEAGEE